MALRLTNAVRRGAFHFCASVQLTESKARGRPCAAGMSVAARFSVQNTLIVQRVAAANGGPTAMQTAETRMIFIVGANVRLMEWAALSLFRAGHIPVLGQWFWPLVTSDTAPAEFEYIDTPDPVAERLLGRCDAVLRVDGPAPDADTLLGMARARGMRVFTSLEDAIAG